MVQMVWQMWLRQVQNLEPLLIQTILKDMQLIKISIIVRIVMGMVFQMQLILMMTMMVLEILLSKDLVQLLVQQD